jgi:uncharacterized membrane protein
MLGQIPLFESLADDELGALAARLSPRPVAAGEVVFRQGETGTELFLVESGAVQVSVLQGPAPVVLATLFDGQYFGELSLFDGAPRSATATCLREGTLLALDQADFVEFVRKSPEASLRIMAEMGERMRQTNELMSRQVAKDVLAEADDQLSLGERVADRVAAFGGSWPFIGLFAGIMVVWMGANAAGLAGFDPYPFILLNLALSTLAALQAPVIMMSQNRQAAKDKLLAQNDYLVNLKAERGVEALLTQHAEILHRLARLERGAHSATAPPHRAEDGDARDVPRARAG